MTVRGGLRLLQGGRFDRSAVTLMGDSCRCKLARRRVDLCLGGSCSVRRVGVLSRYLRGSIPGSIVSVVGGAGCSIRRVRISLRFCRGNMPIRAVGRIVSGKRGPVAVHQLCRRILRRLGGIGRRVPRRSRCIGTLVSRVSRIIRGVGRRGRECSTLGGGLSRVRASGSSRRIERHLIGRGRSGSTLVGDRRGRLGGTDDAVTELESSVRGGSGRVGHVKSEVRSLRSGVVDITARGGGRTRDGTRPRRDRSVSRTSGGVMSAITIPRGVRTITGKVPICCRVPMISNAKGIIRELPVREDIEGDDGDKITDLFTELSFGGGSETSVMGLITSKSLIPTRLIRVGDTVRGKLARSRLMRLVGGGVSTRGVGRVVRVTILRGDVTS